MEDEPLNMEYAQGRDWIKEIENDEFLSQMRRKVDERVGDRKLMTNEDKKYVYPYEYWDEASTLDNADINTARYIEYCRRLGIKPKFVGKLDGKPEGDFGNFLNDKGAWKLLIDRRMYDREGKFQDLGAVSSENFDSKLIDPRANAEEFDVTRVADDAANEEIAKTTIKQEQERMGGMATVNYDLDMEEAVRQFRYAQEHGTLPEEYREGVMRGEQPVQFHIESEEDLGKISEQFDGELTELKNGKLPEGHIFKLGTTSGKLLEAGLPELPIELTAKQLIKKSKEERSRF